MHIFQIIYTYPGVREIEVNFFFHFSQSPVNLKKKSAFKLHMQTHSHKHI